MLWSAHPLNVGGQGNPQTLQTPYWIINIKLAGKFWAAGLRWKLGLFFEVIDTVEKQEEDAGYQGETAAGDCHPVAPGEIRVVGYER